MNCPQIADDVPNDDAADGKDRSTFRQERSPGEEIRCDQEQDNGQESHATTGNADAVSLANLPFLDLGRQLAGLQPSSSYVLRRLAH